MINRFIIVASIINLSQPRLNPHGPVHEKYAVNCLEELAVRQFKYLDAPGGQRTKPPDIQLLTIMTTEGMTTPGFEIQQGIIKAVNVLLQFNIEVIDDARHDFGFEIYTSFCLMVVDSIEVFKRKFQIYAELNSTEPGALFLVYFSKLGRDHEWKASTILEILWKKSVNNALVLIPKSLEDLVLYSMQFNLNPYQHCLKTTGVTPIDHCFRGTLKSTKHYYKSKIKPRFHNCILDVVANKIDPFVINEDEGFEVTFVKEIGRVLNVSFNISITGEDSWGVKDETGRWTHGLRSVYEDSCLGVGNFYVAPEYDSDFAYTVPHWVSDLVWIVPIARYVPSWRVLTIIFNWYLWVLCVCLILVCGTLFKVLSRNDIKPYKKLGHDLLLALEVIITVAVDKHPKSQGVRVVFISLAIFSIIASSLYTSSLITYLTHPQREHQVDSIEGVFDKEWDIGGLPVYENIFHGQDERSVKIHEIFQTNESLEIWLTSVADDRDTCTIGTNFFIQYMLAMENPILTDAKGKPKIYILEDKIFSYSLVIVSNKGFPFLARINYVIGMMNTFGLIQGMAKRYTNVLSKVKAMQVDESSVQQLSLDHLQGAFALLILGYASGLICLLIEIVTAAVKTKIKQTNRIKAV